jgi:hypothetical protein
MYPLPQTQKKKKKKEHPNRGSEFPYPFPPLSFPLLPSKHTIINHNFFFGFFHKHNKWLSKQRRHFSSSKTNTLYFNLYGKSKEKQKFLMTKLPIQLFPQKVEEGRIGRGYGNTKKTTTKIITH